MGQRNKFLGFDQDAQRLTAIRGCFVIPRGQPGFEMRLQPGVASASQTDPSAAVDKVAHQLQWGAGLLGLQR